MLRFRGRSVKLVRGDIHEIASGNLMKKRRVKGNRAGILGGGQLARMSLAPATALGLDLTVLCRDFGESTALSWSDIMLGSPDDIDDVTAVAKRCDVVTFDHELVSTDTIRQLEALGHRFAPSATVLGIAQSKIMQRREFERLQLPIPPFTVIHLNDDLEEIEAFGEMHGWPVMVKANRGGYDGRGVWRTETAKEATLVVQQLQERQIDAVLEAFMPLETEVAILVARNWQGAFASYPLVETVQIDGMLRSLQAPAQVTKSLQVQAEEIASALATSLDIVGLLAVEFFVTGGGLVINEIATRPHNSGHYTIEAAVTSQFEQHLRAVLDLPLGSTELTTPFAATVNIVGTFSPEGVAEALAMPGAHMHLYGKSPRPGRKLGHVTVCAAVREEAIERAWNAVRAIEGTEG